MFKFSGFTLPEIIITIAISAILVSLAHPYFIEILISIEVKQIKRLSQFTYKKPNPMHKPIRKM
jgi:prepilin-type N-terminal cleavage/methylation domain-containing protein